MKIYLVQNNYQLQYLYSDSPWVQLPCFHTYLLKPSFTLISVSHVLLIITVIISTTFHNFVTSSHCYRKISSQCWSEMIYIYYVYGSNITFPIWSSIRSNVHIHATCHPLMDKQETSVIHIYACVLLTIKMFEIDHELVTCDLANFLLAWEATWETTSAEVNQSKQIVNSSNYVSYVIDIMKFWNISLVNCRPLSLCKCSGSPYWPNTSHNSFLKKTFLWHSWHFFARDSMSRTCSRPPDIAASLSLHNAGVTCV